MAARELNDPRVKWAPQIRLRRFAGAAPLGALRPNTNGMPFVPAKGLGLWTSAACKDANGASGGGHSTSNTPAAPMPPPMHMVTQTFLAPRRLPSISAWPVSRWPLTP